MAFNFLKESFTKVKSALNKARSAFGQKFLSLFQGKIDENTLEKIEQALYEADFGVATASELTEKIRALHRSHPTYQKEDYIQFIEDELLRALSQFNSHLQIDHQLHKLAVILIVGVNGNGKTTSVAKLAHLFKQKNQKVLLGAADTFRAAATEQLSLWAEKLNVDIVKGHAKSDPAAVTYDAVSAAKARQCAVVLIDTAGRLHTKTPLMQELEKIKRSCVKAAGYPPCETLLVLDATTGQNAIEQAKHFHKYTPLTGIILTKLDGTAKGGIVFAIQRELGLPIKFIGTGEHVEDLEPFDSQTFVKNLFEF